MRQPIRLALLVLAGALISGSAQAASFNCERARTPDELTICASLKLNDQDVRMAQLYDIAQHLVAMGGRAAIQDDQQVWLRTRRACGADRTCLARAYTRRLAALNKVLERAYKQGPF
ncbi:lysozyme inhibitor LprI family protein [Phenylobacterium sp.]|uniref:lysozyme inhibitor LprI family protein n=1 Tax=Phenylobacterium sp. TaxID=1871053 RepID=UPI0030F45C88